VPVRLESSIERACVKKAKAAGFRLIKLYERGIQDRLLLGNGKAVFIEFKRDGEELSKLQKHKAKEIRKLKFKVYRIDNVKDFLAIMEKL
jgi:hypothetical protein